MSEENLVSITQKIQDLILQIDSTKNEISEREQRLKFLKTEFKKSSDVLQKMMKQAHNALDQQVAIEAEPSRS